MKSRIHLILFFAAIICGCKKQQDDRFVDPDLMPQGVFTAIVSVNNEIYTVIDNKLYK